MKLTGKSGLSSAALPTLAQNSTWPAMVLCSASGKREDSTHQAKAGDKTDFSELSASLKIANGVTRSADIHESILTGVVLPANGASGVLA